MLLTVYWSKRRASSSHVLFFHPLSSIASDILHDQFVTGFICEVEIISGFLTETV